MAYELSASIAASTATSQDVVGTANGQHSGGRFSPDGSIIGVCNARHGAAGSTDQGIDFYVSSSASGWHLNDSLDSNNAEVIRQFVWYDGDTVFVSQGSATSVINQYNSSSSGGWEHQRISASPGMSPAYDIVLNEAKTKAIVYGAAQKLHVYTVSDSGAWSLEKNFNQVGHKPNDDIFDVSWIDNNTFVIGTPDANSSRGELQVYHYNGSSWSKTEQVAGSATGINHYFLGDMVHYHASSSTIIAGITDSTGAKGSMLAIPSASYGFLPASNPGFHGYEISPADVIETSDGNDPRRLLPYGLGLREDPTNGNALLGGFRAKTSSPFDDGAIFTLESGSSGWELAELFNNHASHNSTVNANIDIYSGTAITNNNQLYNADSTFKVWSIAEYSTPDETGPSVSSVTITSATNAQNNTLNEGDVVSVTVSMDEATVVNTTGGTPFITLNIGGVSRNASYASGTGTTSLVFQYTIASSETADTDGISIGANAISLNSGTMQDAAGNNATLTHSAVAANSSFKVDTDKPTISSVVLSADNSTATVTFSEDVYPNSAGSGDLDRFDFSLGLSGGNSSLISLNATPSAISKTSQSIWVLTLNGTDLDFAPGGSETLVVDSADDTSIYDAAGNAHTAAHSGQALNDRTRFVKFRITNQESATRFFYADVGGGTGDDSSDYVFIGSAAAGATLTSSVFSLDKFFGDGKNNNITINSSTAAADLASGGSGGNPITTDAQFISYFNIASGDADDYNSYTLENSRQLVAYGSGNPIQNTSTGTDGIQTGSSNQNKAKYLNITRPSGGRPTSNQNTYGQWTQFDVNNTQLDTIGPKLLAASLPTNTSLKLVFDSKPVDSDGSNLTNADIKPYSSAFVLTQLESDGSTDNDSIKRTTTGSLVYSTTTVTDDTITIPIDYEGVIESGDKLKFRLNTSLYRDIHNNPGSSSQNSNGVIGQYFSGTLSYPSTGSTGTITYDDINFHFVNSHGSKTAHFYVRVDASESGSEGSNVNSAAYLSLGTVAAGQTGSFAVSDIYFDDAKRGDSSPQHRIYAHTASVTLGDLTGSPSEGTHYMDFLTLNQYSSSTQPFLTDNRRNFSASFDGSEWTTQLRIFEGSSTSELDYYTNTGIATLDSQENGTGSITIDWGERIRAKTTSGTPSSTSDLSGGLPNNVFQITQNTGSTDTISNLRIASGSLVFAASARTGIASGSWNLKFHYDGLADGTERLILSDKFEFFHGFYDDELNTAGSGQYWGDMTTTFPDSWENSGTKSGFALSQDALATEKSEAITAADGGTIKAGGTNSAPVGQVVIPANTLAANTTIGVNTADSGSTGNLGLIEKGTAASNLVRLTPHGTKFSSPVTVTIRLKDGAPTTGLSLYKRNTDTGQWYDTQISLTVSDGTVSFTTTSFSDYIIIGGQKVARTKLNNVQLARLENANKVLASAMNLTASENTVASTLIDSDRFLLQSASGESQVISASAMAAYFAEAVQPENIVTTDTDAAGTYRITFTDATGTDNESTIFTDGDLTYNAGTNALSLGVLSASSDLTGSARLLVGTSATIGNGLTVTAGGATITAGGLTVTAGTSDLKGSLIVTGAVNMSTTLTAEGAVSGAAGTFLALAGTSLALQNGGITAAGAIAGATTIAGSGLASLGSLAVDDGSTIGTDSDTDMLTLTNGDKIEVASDVSLVVAAGKLELGDGNAVTSTHTELNMLDGASLGAAVASKALVVDSSRDIGNINHLTASAIRVTDLDVVTINSISQTETTLEIADKLIVASVSGSASDSDGGGLRIGGGQNSVGHASVLWSDADDALDFNIGSTTYASASSAGFGVVGAVSGSGKLHGASVEVDGNIDASGDLTAGTITMSGFAVDADGDTALKSLKVDDGSTIGTDSDSDMLTLTNGDKIEVASDLSFVVAAGKLEIGDGNAVTATATELNYVDVTSIGTVQASKAVVVDADKDATGFRSLTASANIVAAFFEGDGSRLANVGATIVASSDLGVDGGLPLLFASASAGTSKDLFIDPNDITFNPGTNKFHVSGAISGSGALSAASVAVDGNLDASGDLTVGTITMSEFTVAANGNTDIDGTLNVEGVPTFQAGAVFSGGITTAGAIAGATSIDASGDLTVGSITNAEFTVDSSGNTDIDGTLNVEGVPTFQAGAVFSAGITTAGAIGGATTISGSGQISTAVGISAADENFVVNSAGALTAASVDSAGDLTVGTITMTGFAVDADGDTALKSLKIDDASTIGSDTTADVISIAANGAVTFTDNSQNINIAGHDNGTNGLALGGTLVTASAAQINHLGAVSGLDIALASGDGIIFNDANDSQAVKKATMQNVADLLGAGNGLQVNDSTAAIRIDYVCDIYSSASHLQNGLTLDMMTASLSATPLSSSLQVYLNGMLQVISGAVDISGSSAGVYTPVSAWDYKLSDGSSEFGIGNAMDTATKVIFAEAIDEDDVVQIKYIKK